MDTKNIGLTPEEEEYAKNFVLGFTENFTRTYQESIAKIKTLDMPEDKRKNILSSMEQKFEERLRTSLQESLVKVLARRKFEGNNNVN